MVYLTMYQELRICRRKGCRGVVFHLTRAHTPNFNQPFHLPSTHLVLP